MAREINLYHKIIDNEDKLTELLANLLQFSAFKDVFSNFVAEQLGFPDFSFRYSDVETQKKCDKVCKPDLIIENESFCILIECKIYNGRKLTKHQPVSYLSYLDSLTDKKCALIFLIPYYYEYEKLILQRATASKIQPKLVYWTELIKQIQNKISGQNVAVKHFVLLLRAWFEVHPVRFSKEEIMILQNREFPATLSKLIELTDEIYYKFHKPFKLQYLSNQYGFGYYIKNQNGNYLLWFGCFYDYWATQGQETWYEPW
jgi:hypothetical protein